MKPAEKTGLMITVAGLLVTFASAVWLQQGPSSSQWTASVVHAFGKLLMLAGLLTFLASRVLPRLAVRAQKIPWQEPVAHVRSVSWRLLVASSLLASTVTVLQGIAIGLGVPYILWMPLNVAGRVSLLIFIVTGLGFLATRVLLPALRGDWSALLRNLLLGPPRPRPLEKAQAGRLES